MSKKKSLQSFYEQIDDPRSPSGLRHPLVPVLLMVTYAMMSNQKTNNAITIFMKQNVKTFTKMFKLKHGTPSNSQLSTILSIIDSRQMIDLFNEWALQFKQYLGDKEGVAIDGKSLAATVESAKDSQQKFEALVSAFAHEQQLILQVEHYNNGKESEIHCVQKLLDRCEVKGVIMTLDALHCQKKTVSSVLTKGNDYLVRVKKNQAKLYNAIQEHIDTHEPDGEITQQENSKGRIEKRHTRIYNVSDFQAAEGWVGINLLIHTNRAVYRRKSSRWSKKDTGEKYWQQEEDIRICSVQLSCLMSMKKLREHWSVENGLHRVKDTTFNEDRSKISEANMAINKSLLYGVVINLLRVNGFKSIKSGLTYFTNRISLIQKAAKHTKLRNIREL
jgi:predicted transposase YbfD/YdcC